MINYFSHAFVFLILRLSYHRSVLFSTVDIFIRFQLIFHSYYIFHFTHTHLYIIKICYIYEGIVLKIRDRAFIHIDFVWSLHWSVKQTITIEHRLLYRQFILSFTDIYFRYMWNFTYTYMIYNTIYYIIYHM